MTYISREQPLDRYIFSLQLAKIPNFFCSFCRFWSLIMSTLYKPLYIASSSTGHFWDKHSQYLKLNPKWPPSKESQSLLVVSNNQITSISTNIFTIVGFDDDCFHSSYLTIWTQVHNMEDTVGEWSNGLFNIKQCYNQNNCLLSYMNSGAQHGRYCGRME